MQYEFSEYVNNDDDNLYEKVRSKNIKRLEKLSILEHKNLDYDETKVDE